VLDPPAPVVAKRAALDERVPKSTVFDESAKDIFT
jgi:hypothetical protein